MVDTQVQVLELRQPCECRWVDASEHICRSYQRAQVWDPAKGTRTQFGDPVVREGDPNAALIRDGDTIGHFFG